MIIRPMDKTGTTIVLTLSALVALFWITLMVITIPKASPKSAPDPTTQVQNLSQLMNNGSADQNEVLVQAKQVAWNFDHNQERTEATATLLKQVQVKFSNSKANPDALTAISVALSDWHDQEIVNCLGRTHDSSAC